MKRNIKFLSVAISLLLVSSAVLVTSMYAIGSDKGGIKDYTDGAETPGTGNIIENAPVPQNALQEKFYAMYDISDDGKTITVISEEYLADYRQKKDDTGFLYSLSEEEVYFVIQDTIRIYDEYDKIILPAYEPLAEVSDLAKQYNFEVDMTFATRPVQTQEQYYRYEKDLSSIIMYRLIALSSPEAFFTGAEAITFAGGDPMTYSSFYPSIMYYIPGCFENTDREYILTVIGGDTSFMEYERFSDLFAVMNVGNGIFFQEKTTEKKEPVFPTEEMEELQKQLSEGK